MALNLSDPAAIIEAYEAIAIPNADRNWLLLSYSNTHFDELSLLDIGSHGLNELKLRINDEDQVYIGFYRGGTITEPLFAIINYIPSSVSGVKRARVLVHSRHVGAVFKVHQTTLTVDHLDQLTPAAVNNALIDPNAAASTPMGRTTSQPAYPPSVPLKPVRRSFSEAHPPPTPVAPPPMAKSASMFSNFIRRKKKTDDASGDDEEAGPPTPPKDKGKFNVQQQPGHQVDYTAEPQAIPHSRRHRSVSEFAVISHSNSSDDVVVVPFSSRQASVIPTLPLRGKWNPDLLDPADRARQRQEIQRQREIEEQTTRREEAERQAERRRQKEEQIREEMEYEIRKRTSLEEEVRRLTIERKRRERLEREEEERKQMELEERKRLDKERRLEEHRKLEEWRRDQARLAEETARKVEEARQREENERRKKISLAEAKVKQNGADSLLTGWATMQNNDSLVWKRRYFKFIGSTVYFYRSPLDVHQILDKVELRGKLRGLREWNEGYEDLEAIPHSFAIEFKDERGSWSMFADSEEEKYKLLGLLHHAAGL